MTFYYRRALLAACALLAVTGVWPATVRTQTTGNAEHFTASVLDVNTGRTGRIDISVKRWSTASERAALLQTLHEDGSDALLEAVRETRAVGRIYTPGSIGYELRYAHERPLPDGGREIVFATDRPMSFRELTSQPRSFDYPFTWVQVQMRPDGTGEGKIAVAARITGGEADQGIEIEDFALQPVRLRTVESRKP